MLDYKNSVSWPKSANNRGRNMRKFLLVTSAAVCVLATPAFATTGTFHTQGQYGGVAASAAIPSQGIGSFLVPGARDTAILVAQNGGKTTPPGNSGSNGNDNGNNGKSGKPECDDITPAHPCTGNNGFGNGGKDGSPNGKQDDTR
jgi:hypothetical protein